MFSFVKNFNRHQELFPLTSSVFQLPGDLTIQAIFLYKLIPIAIGLQGQATLNSKTGFADRNAFIVTTNRKEIPG